MKINITKSAQDQLENRYMNPERAFRIMINGFGWGGPVFGVVLDEQRDEDYMEESNGMKIVVQEDILNQFGSFKIDYISNLFRKGFVVSTAYGTGTC